MAPKSDIMSLEKPLMLKPGNCRNCGTHIGMILRKAKDESERTGFARRNKRLVIGLAAIGVLAGVLAGTGQFKKVNLKRMHDAWVNYMIDSDKEFRASVGGRGAVGK